MRKTRRLAEAAAEGELKGKFKAMKHASPQQKVELFLTDMIENTSVQQAVDVALYGGLAYAGYEVFKDWKGALVGPVALKLATSPNEIASAAGLGMLAALGIAGIPGVTDALKNLAAATAAGYAVGAVTIGPEWACPQGYALMVKEGEYACMRGYLAFMFEWQGWVKVPFRLHTDTYLACVKRFTAKGFTDAQASEICFANENAEPGGGGGVGGDGETLWELLDSGKKSYTVDDLGAYVHNGGITFSQCLVLCGRKGVTGTAANGYCSTY